MASKPKPNCGCCGQPRPIERDGYCGPCLEGMAKPMRYECDRCHGQQRIPHPMWKYQGKADEFTGATWACHVGCGDYTHWKIAKEDLPKIPENGPESWGPRECWLPSAEEIGEGADEEAEDEETDDEEEEDPNCGCCGQARPIERDGYCGPCLEGMAKPMRYECDRCHGQQQIPHPMWTYQGKADEFTGATWACHMACNDYTHWKVAKEDLPKIPGNGPESWGPRKSWLP